MPEATYYQHHAMDSDYDSIKAIADYLQNLDEVKVFKPQVAVICGSGLGCLPSKMTSTFTIPYKMIPGFPQSTVVGHAGELVFGRLSGVDTICMKGRFHAYEGKPLATTVMPIRLFKMLGIHTLIVSNAAGGIRADMEVSEVMMIYDQINFLGFANQSPLTGPNDERFGPRFPAMNKAYDRKLTKTGLELLQKHGLKCSKGVYAGFGGPTYETIAEVKMLRTLGADSVGMSTVSEVVAAAHCGLRVAGFSLITNVAVTDYDDDTEPCHEEIVAAVKAIEGKLGNFMVDFVHECGTL